MDATLKYKVNLPTEINEILNSDFWIYNNIPSQIASYSTEPMKFSSSAFILLRQGRCVIDINLQRTEVTAPAYINITANSYLHILEVSEDLIAGVIVASPTFLDRIAIFFRDRRINLNAFDSRILQLERRLGAEFIKLFNDVQNLYNDTENPDRLNAILYHIVGFFYANSYRILKRNTPEHHTSAGKRLTVTFLSMVQRNFMTEHTLDFYADNLKVSTKHLSRIVKSITGYSASQWIDRYLILEAKVKLKSTGMTVSEIAHSLSFSTPSSFGKFFRKHTGISPKQFSKTVDI